MSEAEEKGRTPRKIIGDDAFMQLVFEGYEVVKAGGWRDISSAPKDGTKVLLWMVHQNAKYSDDPIGEGWAAAVTAEWIDHNGGGWTWYGVFGQPTHWMPLPKPPLDTEKTG